MKHLIRPIEVYQGIEYSHAERDEFQYQRQAHHYQLKTYEKLVFEDYNHQPIQIKWWQEASGQSEWVEIQQSAGTLRFHCGQRISNPYQTGQGLWLLESITEHIDLSSGIEIHYKLELGQESLANYEFQLIFKD